MGNIIFQSANYIELYYHNREIFREKKQNIKVFEKKTFKRVQNFYCGKI